MLNYFDNKMLTPQASAVTGSSELTFPPYMQGQIKGPTNIIRTEMKP